MSLKQDEEVDVALKWLGQRHIVRTVRSGIPRIARFSFPANLNTSPSKHTLNYYDAGGFVGLCLNKRGISCCFDPN